ncbi:MAG: FprA family A-type flavoprotein [Proteobacteria bacterium]|nr:FprA family A-type flavoprotein [Pseudomonadota bacterium]
MSALEIRKGIYWVGAVDWDIRNFHGYLTEHGTTYNAYLVVDEKVVLIDTVKSELADRMLHRIGQVVDPDSIDYVLSNHVEMDHSGAIPRIMELAPQAKIVASKQGEKGLRRHYNEDWDFQVVKSGDSINIGRGNLSFVNTPMVHWPDSMVTYHQEEKILFSNDAFGQHVASAERFDDEVGWSLIKREAKKYYANIVMPFGKQVNKALSGLSGLDIETICPSHGLIWRSFIPKIVSEYGRWANHATDAKALIVYDSMWHSTEKMAWALEDGLSEAGIPVTMRNLKVNHISDVMTDVLNSKMILLGSPTLNNGMLPTMGQFVTYLKGLKPKDRLGFAFGSYGWGGQAVGELEKAMDEMQWERPLESTKIEYVPDDDELSGARETGRKLGESLLKATS